MQKSILPYVTFVTFYRIVPFVTFRHKYFTMDITFIPSAKSLVHADFISDVKHCQCQEHSMPLKLFLIYNTPLILLMYINTLSCVDLGRWQILIQVVFRVEHTILIEIDENRKGCSTVIMSTQLHWLDFFFLIQIRAKKFIAKYTIKYFKGCQCC